MVIEWDDDPAKNYNPPSDDPLEWDYAMNGEFSGGRNDIVEFACTEADAPLPLED